MTSSTNRCVQCRTFQVAPSATWAGGLCHRCRLRNRVAEERRALAEPFTRALLDAGDDLAALGTALARRRQLVALDAWYRGLATWERVARAVIEPAQRLPGGFGPSALAEELRARLDAFDLGAALIEERRLHHLRRAR